MSNFVKHSEIISSIPSKFAQAKSSGSLFFYPSTRVRVTENNFNFIISTCPALQQKPILPAPDFAQHDKPDPFAPPYVPDLFVGEIKDELDGDEYAILLNKFSVISGHFLMVTKGFQPQNSPLTPSDLSQAYLLIRAARKSPTPIFAFYNCGANSGASQPHKHIQFIPSSQNVGEDDEEEEDESSGPPAEAFVRTLKIEDDTKVFTLPLPYVHLAVRLDLPKPIQTGSKSLSAESLETLSNTLTHAFMRLLDEAVQTVRLYHDSQGSDLGPAGPGRASVPSYNVLLTGEHMHLIPRLREDTVDELKPEPGAEGEEVHEPQRLSINSLGFAGMLLAKSDAELRAIKVKGVVELLKQVGVPKVEEAAPEESTQSLYLN